MRLLAGAAVLAATLPASACRRDISITADTDLSALQPARSFRVPAGVTVTATGDLRIDATRDVVIEGEIRAAGASGADITIESSGGDIRILGELRAGDGRPALPLEAVGEAIVREVPENGGDLVLSAPSGNVVVEGSVTAGAGGRGGDATALGPAELARAESGVGGNGGDVRLEAGDDVSITAGATVSAGPGGQGGRAQAGGNPVPPPDDDGDADDGNGPQQTLAGAAPVDRAVALARRGGRGGEARLRPLSPSGRILVAGDLEAGRGGDTFQAVATGREAEATTLDAARGGSVILDAEASRITVSSDPEPGDGGSNGVSAGPPWAFATGEVEAFAKVGAGGSPGSVLVAGSVTEVGEGGNNASSRTQILNPAMSSGSPGSESTGPEPAPAHQSELPR